MVSARPRAGEKVAGRVIARRPRRRLQAAGGILGMVLAVAVWLLILHPLFPSILSQVAGGLPPAPCVQRGSDSPECQRVLDEQRRQAQIYAALGRNVGSWQSYPVAVLVGTLACALGLVSMLAAAW